MYIAYGFLLIVYSDASIRDYISQNWIYVEVSLQTSKLLQTRGKEYLRNFVSSRDEPHRNKGERKTHMNTTILWNNGGKGRQESYLTSSACCYSRNMSEWQHISDGGKERPEDYLTSAACS